MSRRRSNRSAQAPANPLSAIRGATVKKATRASGVACPVWRKTAMLTASPLIWLPSSETACASSST
jgi:hypothetical protein